MRLGRRRRSGERRPVLRKDRTGAAAFKVGALVLAISLVVTYFGFAKDMPFTHGFRVKAVFGSAVSIREDSPVRIAGVDVGKVKKVERAGDGRASVVTMELEEKALPIHHDATLQIRPRIFLEGNFFVDLRPVTPGGRRLEDNQTVPITRSASPVQLDEGLTSLQSDARQDVKDVL